MLVYETEALLSQGSSVSPQAQHWDGKAGALQLDRRSLRLAGTTLLFVLHRNFKILHFNTSVRPTGSKVITARLNSAIKPFVSALHFCIK